jgi:hypothetical protein
MDFLKDGPFKKKENRFMYLYYVYKMAFYIEIGHFLEKSQ